MTAATKRRSTSHYPDDYSIKELAGTTVIYDVTVKAVRKRIVPELDDEFAKDLGDFDIARRAAARVRGGSRARSQARGGSRAARGSDEAVGVAGPPSRCRRRCSSARSIGGRGVRAAADRSADRSDEDEHQLGRVPRAQRDAAAKRSRALVLDEVARREKLRSPTTRSTRRSRGTASAQAGRRRRCAPGWRKRGVSGVLLGLRRERAIDFLLSRATIRGVT